MEVRELNSYEEARLPRDGVIVNSIKEGSQIASVNMEENFIITRINGIPISSMAGLHAELERSGSNVYLQGYYEEYPGDFAYSLEIK